MQPLVTTRPVPQAVLDVLAKLQPGQRIKVTQTVRVGMKSWPHEVTGTFRHVDSLATGLATDRIARDDIIVPIIHFTKDNKEMSTVSVDENTKIELLAS